MTRVFDLADLTRAKAKSADEIYIACAPEEDDVGYPFTRISHYKDGTWNHRDFKFWVCSMAMFGEDGQKERLVMLGQEGEFVDYKDPDKTEQVFDPETKAIDQPDFGYVYNINQIGTHLYVCGMNGQNYKRYENGVWAEVDKSVIAASSIGESTDYDRRLNADPSLANDDDFMNKYISSIAEQSALDFQHITGLSENSIYMCGGKGNLESVLMQNRGEGFQPLSMDSPIVEEDTPSLNYILFEDGEKKMRVCGQRGAMLVGNARDGFRQDPAATEDILYYNMAMFGGKIYIASHLGLLVHNGVEIFRVRTGLEPDAIDTHTVQAVDGALWLVGIKDILQYDGETWKRIQYPGNDQV